MVADIEHPPFQNLCIRPWQSISFKIITISFLFRFEKFATPFVMSGLFFLFLFGFGFGFSFVLEFCKQVVINGCKDLKKITKYFRMYFIIKYNFLYSSERNCRRGAIILHFQRKTTPS